MWTITAWHCVSPEVIAKGFKKFCVYAAMYAVEWQQGGWGKLAASVCKMETVILIGKGAQNVTHFVY
jgi:hypothetical protein